MRSERWDLDVRNKKHWFNLSAGRRVMAAPGKQPNKAEKKKRQQQQQEEEKRLWVQEGLQQGDVRIDSGHMLIAASQLCSLAVQLEKRHPIRRRMAVISICNSTDSIFCPLSQEWLGLIPIITGEEAVNYLFGISTCFLYLMCSPPSTDEVPSRLLASPPGPDMKWISVFVRRIANFPVCFAGFFFFLLLTQPLLPIPSPPRDSVLKNSASELRFISLQLTLRTRLHQACVWLAGATLPFARQWLCVKERRSSELVTGQYSLSWKGNALVAPFSCRQWKKLTPRGQRRGFYLAIFLSPIICAASH